MSWPEMLASLEGREWGLFFAPLTLDQGCWVGASQTGSGSIAAEWVGVVGGGGGGDAGMGGVAAVADWAEIADTVACGGGCTSVACDHTVAGVYVARTSASVAAILSGGRVRGVVLCWSVVARWHRRCCYCYSCCSLLSMNPHSSCDGVLCWQTKKLSLWKRKQTSMRSQKRYKYLIHNSKKNIVCSL